MDQQSPVARAPYPVALASITALLTGMLIAVLDWTGGVFVYSLDDPYIHLAMAEQIRLGGYGVNAGEPASAASSIVYPYLVALGLIFGAGVFAPLAINCLAALALIALVVCIFRDAGLLRRRLPWWVVAVLVIVWALLLNVAGIVFMGMEHALQAAMALLAFFGLLRFLRSDRAPPWLSLVLGLQVAVRFESASVLAAGIFILLLRGRWKAALLAGGIATAVLGVFVLYLQSLGLPSLPSSVLIKARSYWADNPAFGYAQRPIENLGETMGVVLLVLVLLLLWLGLRQHAARLWPPRDWPADRLAALFVILCVGAHLVLGVVCWPHRYEHYVVVLAATAAVALAAPVITAAMARARAGLVLIASGVLATAAFKADIAVSLATPLTAREIHLQQGQMSRFAQEFVRGPVAVNDLGLTAWHNPYYVLDLWGLASNDVRIERLASDDPAWMARLAQRHDASLAMIYEDAFDRLPADWRKLGELGACAPSLNAGGERVAFYATAPHYLPRLADLAKQWRRDLPPRAFFVFEGEAPPCARRRGS